jgi:hypothetical protein
MPTPPNIHEGAPAVEVDVDDVEVEGGVGSEPWLLGGVRYPDWIRYDARASLKLLVLVNSGGELWFPPGLP